MFGRLILTTSLWCREQTSGTCSALVLGSGRAVGRVQGQVEFERIDTRFPQDTKITRLGILSDQRFYLLRCDRSILSAQCPASIHHPVHLEQSGFDRDIRIEATSARGDDICGERRIGGQPVLLAEQFSIGFHSQVGARNVVSVRLAWYRCTASRREHARGDGHLAPVALDKLWIGRSQVGPTGVGGVVPHRTWSTMKVFGARELLPEQC